MIGTDVRPIATHFAAFSLAAIGQGDAYGVTKIGWVKVGGSIALTGSLEYLEAGSVSDLFGEVVGAASGRPLPIRKGIPFPCRTQAWTMF